MLVLTCVLRSSVGTHVCHQFFSKPIYQFFLKFCITIKIQKKSARSGFSGFSRKIHIWSKMEFTRNFTITFCWKQPTYERCYKSVSLCRPISRKTLVHKLYLKMLSSNQITGFFDHQYLWKEYMNIVDFFHGDIHTGRQHLKLLLLASSMSRYSQSCPNLHRFRKSSLDFSE